MKSIDFLPDVYRQRESLRRARMWWMAVVMLFGGAILSAAMGQAWIRHSVVEQLDALAPEFAAAQARVQELAALQTQVARTGQEAGLYTFLQNPWPRTQLLAEIVRPLNDTIRLTRLALTEEEIAKSVLPLPSRNDKQAEDAAAKASPAEKDLALMDEEANRRQTAIEIEGQTAAVSQLHEYVSQLSHSPLIASATIKSLEAATSNEQRQTRFTLRLIVRPGYCQRMSASGGIAASINDRGVVGGVQ
jgi:hypothetical protein